jgi:hypothetical protein
MPFVLLAINAWKGGNGNKAFDPAARALVRVVVPI